MLKNICVTWIDADQYKHQDWFVTREMGERYWGKIVGELSYVQIWDNPEEGVRRFMQHLPLFQVEIVGL